MSDMQKAPETEAAELPPDLRFLKILVTALTATMIVGLITIIGLIVTRLPHGVTEPPALPAKISLPGGLKPMAVTFGAGWVAVVTTTGEILIFDAVSGRETQRVKVGG